MMLLFSTALAAPVLYLPEEGPDAAIAKVALHDQQKLSEMTALVLGELTDDDEARLKGGFATACMGGPATVEDIRVLVDEAEGDLTYMELDSAQLKLAHAMADELCLDVPVDAPLAARAHYLYGVAAVRAGDKPQAWESFQRALRYNPELVWDERFPPEGRATFDAARAELGSMQRQDFRVVGGSKVWVDGHPRDTLSQLTPGPHTVQVGDELVTVLAELNAGMPGTLVLPAGLVDADLAMAADAEGRDVLGAALHAIGGAEVWYVSLPDALWKLDPASGEWTDLLEPAEVTTMPYSGEPVVEPVVEPTERQPGRALMAVGGVAVVGGGLTMAVAASEGRTLWQAAQAAPNGASWDLAAAGYRESETKFNRAAAVTGVGAAVLATGVVVTWSF